MADNIVTSLELQLKGVQGAISGMNQVGAASRKMAFEAQAAETASFGKLAKFSGHIGGAGKYDYLFIKGIGEAIEQANGSWIKLSQGLATGAGFAAAAISINMVTEKAKELSDETDKLYEEMGKPKPGMFQNILDGYKSIWDEITNTPIVINTRAPTRDEFAAAATKSRGEEANRQYDALQPESQKAEFLRRYQAASAGESDPRKREALAAQLEESIKQERAASATWKTINDKLREELSVGIKGVAGKFFDAYNSGKTKDLGGTVGEQYSTFSAMQQEEDKAAAAAASLKKQRDQERLSLTKKEAEKEYSRMKRNTRDQLEDLINPKFASGDVTRGSAAAYSQIASFEARGNNQEEAKRLQKEQLEQTKRQTQILQRLTDKAIAVFSIN